MGTTVGLGIDDLLAGKRDDILRLAREHGASNLRIFGSVARGEAGPASDVDVLVDLDPERSCWCGGELLLDLAQLLGRKVHLVTEGSLHWYIRSRVLEEAVTL